MRQLSSFTSHTFQLVANQIFYNNSGDTMNKLQFDALRQAIGRILGVSNFKDLPAGFRATNAWQALQGAIVEAGEVFSEGAEVLEPEMIQSLQTQSRRAIAAYWLAENTIETISKATEKVKKDFNPAAQSE